LPSPLFNFLFLVALIVPISMHVVGVVILMASLVWKHWAVERMLLGHVEAPAH
jgi:hypothetical protein